MSVHQIIYTSCMRGINGVNDGQQVFSYDAEFTDADNDDIKSFEDLEGKTTANTLASTYSLLAESYGAKATGVDSLADTILLVEQGRVDATLNADVSFFDYMKVHTDAPLKIVAETDTPSKVSIPVRKGEPEFLEAIDDAIAQLRESGELREISIKYFGSDVTE